MYDNKRIGLSVCGGGARSIIQAGMLKAFKDTGVDYDFIRGCSAGALNASLIQQDSWDLMEEMWLHISNDKVFKFHWWTIPNLLFNKNNLYDSAPLKNLINEVVDYKKIIANPKPFHINVTNLTKWKAESYSPRDLSESDFKTLLLASASPPGAFQPIEWNNCMYADGGVTNNFSLEGLIEDGSDWIFMLTPTRHGTSKFQNEIDMFTLLVSVPEYCYLDRELGYVERINKIQAAFPNLREIKTTIIEPKVQYNISLLNFNYKVPPKDLIQEGYQMAQSLLATALSH